MNQETCKAQPQPGERLTLPLFLCATDKPMMEMEANSNTWFQAHIIRESLDEIQVLFPGESSLLGPAGVAMLHNASSS